MIEYNRLRLIGGLLVAVLIVAALGLAWARDHRVRTNALGEALQDSCVQFNWTSNAMTSFLHQPNNHSLRKGMECLGKAGHSVDIASQADGKHSEEWQGVIIAINIASEDLFNIQQAYFAEEEFPPGIEVKIKEIADFAGQMAAAMEEAVQFSDNDRVSINWLALEKAFQAAERHRGRIPLSQKLYRIVRHRGPSPLSHCRI